MSKRALYGLDTKVSAKRVEAHVLAKVRRPMKKKKLFQLIPIMILAVAVCFFLYGQIESAQDKLLATTIKDELVVEVSPLTEEDVSAYRSRRVTEAELRAHYRAFLFNYHVVKEPGQHVKIEHSHHPQALLNSIDSVERYATGGGWLQNNDSEDFAEEQYRFVFNMKDLTEEELKQALKKYELSVTWQNEQGEFVTETILLGEYVKFVER